jgi:hypothetical protein
MARGNAEIRTLDHHDIIIIKENIKPNVAFSPPLVFILMHKLMDKAIVDYRLPITDCFKQTADCRFPIAT